jgi:hypothetical protein
MTAPVRAVAAEAEAEAAEAAEAAEVEAAEVEAAVQPSQGRLFAAALPLHVRLPRSAQRLPLRLYLLPWPPVWLALFGAR